VPGSLHCATNSEYLRALVKILRFPFAAQILCGCKPLCQQTLKETFSLDSWEEFRSKELEFKAKENEI